MSPLKGKKQKKEHIIKRVESRKNNGGYIISHPTREKMRKSHLGKKLSNETKEKMRKRMQGNSYRIGAITSEDTKKKLRNAFIGKPLKEEHKRKISDKARERVRLGIHNFWKGGICPRNTIIRNSKEMKDWKFLVLKRDNFSCQNCGENKNLNADHIKPFSLFPKLRFSIDNGRTLCYGCHKKTDTFGKSYSILKKMYANSH